jgi:hypothetical protein
MRAVYDFTLDCSPPQRLLEFGAGLEIRATELGAAAAAQAHCLTQGASGRLRAQRGAPTIRKLLDVRPPRRKPTARAHASSIEFSNNAEPNSRGG